MNVGTADDCSNLNVIATNAYVVEKRNASAWVRNKF